MFHNTTRNYSSDVDLYICDQNPLVVSPLVNPCSISESPQKSMTFYPLAKLFESHKIKNFEVAIHKRMQIQGLVTQTS